jgi:hypothetical protein
MYANEKVVPMTHGFSSAHIKIIEARKRIAAERLGTKPTARFARSKGRYRKGKMLATIKDQRAKCYRYWVNQYNKGHSDKEAVLVNSTVEKVRCALAYNTRNYKVMKALAIDKSPVVRKIIARRSTGSLLDSMADDVTMPIRRLVAKRTENKVTLIRLLGDVNSTVICSAINNPLYTNAYRCHVNTTLTEVQAYLDFGDYNTL